MTGADMKTTEAPLWHNPQVGDKFTVKGSTDIGQVSRVRLFKNGKMEIKIEGEKEDGYKWFYAVKGPQPAAGLAGWVGVIDEDKPYMRQ